MEAIELEKEIVKRKGFIEQTFWRFLHIEVYKKVILEGMNSNGTVTVENNKKK